MLATSCWHEKGSQVETVAAKPRTPVTEEGATRYRAVRDAYGWEVGGGPYHVARGTLIVGRIIRRNDSVRRVVIDTGESLLTLNEEDLELVDSIH